MARGAGSAEQLLPQGGHVSAVLIGRLRGVEEAVPVPRAGLQEGLHQELASQGAPEGPHGRAALQVSVDSHKMLTDLRSARMKLSFESDDESLNT